MMRVLCCVLLLTFPASLGAQAKGAAPRPPAPAQVTAVLETGSTIRVSWTRVPEATAYDIGRLVAPGGWQRLKRVPAGDTTYVDVASNVDARPHTYQVVTIAGDLASVPARSQPVQGGYKAASGGSGAPARPDSSAFHGAARCTAGDAGFTRCTSAVATWVSPMTDPGWFRKLDVYCPAGTTIVSGGYIGDSDRVIVSASYPTERAWHIEFREAAASAGLAVPPDAPANRIRAYALCRRA